MDRNKEQLYRTSSLQRYEYHHSAGSHNIHKVLLR